MPHQTKNSVLIPKKRLIGLALPNQKGPNSKRIGPKMMAL